MTTLKKQLNDAAHDAEVEITKILQEFCEKTGYVPAVINVPVIDTSCQGEERSFIVNQVSLTYND